jgi:hypothetical protein
MSTGLPTKKLTTVHGAVFFVILLIVLVGFHSLMWPWYLVLPFAIYGGIVSVVGPLCRIIPKLAIGRLDGWPLLYAAVLALITTGVLLGFHAQV